MWLQLAIFQLLLLGCFLNPDDHLCWSGLGWHETVLQTELSYSSWKVDSMIIGSYIDIAFKILNYFKNIILFNNKFKRQSSYFNPYFAQGKRGLEKLKGLPKATQFWTFKIRLGTQSLHSQCFPFLLTSAIYHLLSLLQYLGCEK